ncbi:hypothetical protein ABKV19_013516 [Rosa sericea]
MAGNEIDIWMPRKTKGGDEIPHYGGVFKLELFLPEEYPMAAPEKKIAELKASRKQTAKATVATTAKSAKAAATSTSTSTRPPTSTKASKGQAPIVSISSQRIRDNSKQGGK